MSGSNGGADGQDGSFPPASITSSSLDQPARDRVFLTPLQAELTEYGIEPDPGMLPALLALVSGVAGPTLTEQPIKDAK